MKSQPDECRTVVNSNERRRAATRLEEILKKHSLLSGLRGSWVRGDFHFSRTRHESFSDVDLVLPVGTPGREGVISAVEAEICIRLLPMRVSVHPGDFLARLSRPDSLLVLAAEYVYQCLGPVQRGEHTQDYVLAKTTLQLLRTSPSQSFAELVEKNPTILQTVEVKLGAAEELSRENCLHIVRSTNDKSVHRFAEDYLGERPTAILAEKAFHAVASSAHAEVWLRDYMLRKLSTVC